MTTILIKIQYQDEKLNINDAYYSLTIMVKYILKFKRIFVFWLLRHWFGDISTFNRLYHTYRY